MVESLWWRLIRFGFRLLYNEFAWTYDLVSQCVSLGNWRQWQRASIQYLPTATVDPILEIAHGTADLQIDLADSGFYTIGFDVSPYMGRLAYRKLYRKGVSPRLVRANAMELPFPNSRFVAVVSTFPTEFIIHPDTLHEVFRVLRPGGRFVIVPNGMLTLASPLARLLEWLYRITGQRDLWPGDALKAFRDSGFHVEVRSESLPSSNVTLIIADKSH